MSLFDHQPSAFESATPRAPQTLDDLRQQYRHLRLLLNLALACMLLLAATVGAFFYKQMRLVRTKVNETRPLVQRMAAEFNRKEPDMRKFVSALQSYAFTVPDFYSVLSKYTNVLPQYFVSPVRAPVAPPGAVLPPPATPAGQTPQSAKPSTK